MRRRSIILACVGLILISSLIVAVWSWQSASHHPSKPLRAPVLGVLTVESGIGIIKGGEMNMVSFTMFNPNSSLDPENLLFITSATFEARVSNQWSKVTGSLPYHISGSSVAGLIVILMPAGADRCRVSLQYAGGSVPFRTRLGHSLRNQLGRLQAILPVRFWAWLTVNYQYSPRLPWKETQLQVEIPSPAPHAK